MRSFILLVSCVLAANLHAALMLVTNVELQPLHAHVARVESALEFLGAPLSQAEIKELDAAPVLPAADAVAKIQSILDRHALFGVTINPEMRVKVAVGDARPALDEQGWSVFRVKGQKDSSDTPPLEA